MRCHWGSCQEMPVDGKSRCQAHADIENARQRKIRAEHRRLGLCTFGSCTNAASANRTYCKKHRDRHNAQIKKRVKTIHAQYGTKCSYTGCKKTVHLRMHHNHRLQQIQQCCISRNGCVRCRVCLLCNHHNTLLGQVRDSVEDAKVLLQFLEGL